MSQPPRNKPPIRQVPVRNSGDTASTGSSGRSSGGSGSAGKNMSSGRSQPSGGETRYSSPGGGRTGGSNRGASDSGGYGRSGGRDRYDRDYDRDYGRYGPPPPRDYRRTRPRSVQSQRDPFPYIMGGIIGALIVGLGLVIILLLNNNKNNTPTAAGPSGTAVAGGAATAASSDPPRMALADFKALYDDPAKRPLIIDVRTVDTFDAGHIQGAISFPEADVDSSVSKLPKDKLIVAYCQ